MMKLVGLGEVVRGTEVTGEAIERVIADVVEPVRVHMLIAGARYTVEAVGLESGRSRRV